jgi:protein-S-isoprenylcysteine O-methyltransferase Ste14
MSDVPIASAALRILTAVTFAAQIGLLLAVPIPSPVSSRRVWMRRSGVGASPSDTSPADPPGARLLPLAALAGWLAVLAAVVWTGDVLPYLLPAGTSGTAWLPPVSGAFLLVGNALIAAAVLTLKRHTTFDAAGQSRALVTGGIFAFIQHPVVSGLGLIYLGFFLALPSPLVLVGLACYGWHQQRRVKVEEVLLAKRFGQRYRAYQGRVGRFLPRWPGRRERG